MTEQPFDAIPTSTLPFIKTDLHALTSFENVIIWMGHSSYYLPIDRIRFLIDPVFSENASPVPYTNVVFSGSNYYQANDSPEIDYLLITHDNWDHLDYPTVMALKNKIKQVVAPIGVGSYFAQWGFEPERITETDWYDSLQTDALQIATLPAQHFSGAFTKA